MKPVQEHEFTTYPRRFVSYRWYKPLFVGVLFFVFMLIFAFVVVLAGAAIAGDARGYLESLSGGYDSFDVTTAEGALGLLGSVAVMLPALALASLIVRDRPFSSYASARGGWDWRLFARMMLIALLVCGVPNVILILLEGGTPEIGFTLPGFVMLTVLGPIQCIAEEYSFRGLLMQTFGSWFRLPLLAVILQSALFAAMHPYNLVGVLTIFSTGLMMGLAAWLTRGIEASSALHIVNNMIGFYAAGLGLSEISSEVSLAGLIVTVVIDVVFLLVLALCGRRYHWYDRIVRDDVTPFNAAKEARRRAGGKQRIRLDGVVPEPQYPQAGWQQNAPQYPQGGWNEQAPPAPEQAWNAYGQPASQDSRSATALQTTQDVQE